MNSLKIARSGLRHHVGEHGEPPAVRHADRDLSDAELAAALDDLLERRDHRFAAVDAEALGAGIFQIAEFFERLGFDQFPEDRLTALRREADVLLRAFDALLNPALLRRIGNVRELNANLAAVRTPQNARGSGASSPSRDP